MKTVSFAEDGAEFRSSSWHHAWGYIWVANVFLAIGVMAFHLGAGPGDGDVRSYAFGLVITAMAAVINILFMVKSVRMLRKLANNSPTIAGL